MDHADGRIGARPNAADPQPAWVRLAVGRQHTVDRGSADPYWWASAEAWRARLKAREWEVLSVLITGASNREISACLHISPNTVAKHLANIFDKLQADNRTQAVAQVLGIGPDTPALTGNLRAGKPDTHYRK